MAGFRDSFGFSHYVQDPLVGYIYEDILYYYISAIQWVDFYSE